MPRKKANNHYLYKTTCLITGRYYIGMHSTANLEDGYMGSGKRLRYSLRKHGKENHVKEILEFFESRELLIEAEKVAITEEMLVDNMCMNIMSGGTGGFISIEQQCYRSSCGGKAHTEKLRNDKIYYGKFIIRVGGYLKESHMAGKIRYNTMLGKQHSEETKNRMRKSKNRGFNNSQYNTIWITNGIECKKIKKNSDIPNGWYKGRK